MELTNSANVNPEFGEPTETNIDGLTMINIRQGGKKLTIPTGKCFSFGVRKDVKFGTVTMSIVLDESHRKSNIQGRATPRQTIIEGPVSQERGNRYDLGEARKIQERNLNKILPGRKGDRPQNLRRQALRGESRTPDQRDLRLRREGKPSGEGFRGSG